MSSLPQDHIYHEQQPKVSASLKAWRVFSLKWDIYHLENKNGCCRSSWTTAGWTGKFCYFFLYLRMLYNENRSRVWPVEMCKGQSWFSLNFNTIFQYFLFFCCHLRKSIYEDCYRWDWPCSSLVWTSMSNKRQRDHLLKTLNKNHQYDCFDWEQLSLWFKATNVDCWCQSQTLCSPCNQF